MTQYNRPILEAAGEYLGLEEWPGARSNPKIENMFADVGHPGNGDETAWCAAFVGSVLASIGLPHTGKLNARSYVTYGSHVRMQDARPGDIVVFWRGSPTSWQGHVAFFVRYDGDNVIVRGGNQGNKVSDAPYPVSRIVAVRRADGVEAQGKRPVLREGDRGAFVHDLQAQLAMLGYTLGKQDGQFGSRTLAAVVAFQNDNGLTSDGVVGDRTWTALGKAEHRPLRDVTKEDIKDTDTFKAANQGKATVAAASGVLGAGIVIDGAEQAVEVAQRAGSLLSGLSSAGPWVLGLLVVGVVAFLLWRFFTKVQEDRLRDARTGANDSV